MYHLSVIVEVSRLPDKYRLCNRAWKEWYTMLERDKDVKWQHKKAPYATWQRTYLYLNCA